MRCRSGREGGTGRIVTGCVLRPGVAWGVRCRWEGDKGEDEQHSDDVASGQGGTDVFHVSASAADDQRQSWSTRTR